MHDIHTSAWQVCTFGLRSLLPPSPYYPYIALLCCFMGLSPLRQCFFLVEFLCFYTILIGYLGEICILDGPPATALPAVKGKFSIQQSVYLTIHGKLNPLPEKKPYDMVSCNCGLQSLFSAALCCYVHAWLDKLHITCPYPRPGAVRGWQSPSADGQGILAVTWQRQRSADGTLHGVCAGCVHVLLEQLKRF